MLTSHISKQYSATNKDRRTLRLFRKLYDAVRSNERFGDSQKVIESFSMNTSPVESKVSSLGEVAGSPSVVWLHFPVVLTVVVLVIYAGVRRFC